MVYLFIVESPSKAKTIAGYLGKEYRILSTLGHVADLPKATLGVDLKNAFEPEYVPLPGKKKVISEIIKAAKESDAVYLATDPDREGEFISSYLLERFKKKSNVFRIRFTEVTKNAIRSSIQNPTSISQSLVDAQKARRIGDRLIGYFVSPVLWKEIGPGLSAGRVQSVALKWICERENEIRVFQPETYYKILIYTKDKNGIEGIFQRKGDRIDSREKADSILKDIEEEKELIIATKKESAGKNFPPPPFQTASLQQEAFRRFHFSSRKTMNLAQTLYEGVDLGQGQREGLITYMRTDSVRLNPEFVSRTSSWIRSRYGEDYFVPYENRTKVGKKNTKNIQDAHEAIRVTDPGFTPDLAGKILSKDQTFLYELIWKRTVASLLPPEEFQKTEYSIFVKDEIFSLETKRTTFPGFKILNEITEKEIPVWKKGQTIFPEKTEALTQTTEPPHRYTEGSLVSRLEKEGIGRPSTYAAVAETLLKRKYVDKDRNSFFPLPLGEKVNFFLQTGFGELFREKFTAELENSLDRVEKGEANSLEILNRLWSDLKYQIETSKLNSNDFRKNWAVVREEKKKIGWGTCPLCKTGALQRKKTAKKKEFYQCDRFPDCEFVSYDLPSSTSV
ncbi:type I DNA topoisomerase [Leptospira gomenensis]|uniref:DNA topoisomerase 1 n=1 Tax=Leptospira gomenensis TaxID=2484974 RepID=A0A5F1YCV6_9LEPT|nr:type I DNA topoisomerase [Leptospira gomenensis]TGK33175.1 type I DNA topoisomerase [Leptospira gomenensis]TGK35591.1 type I DNA topoisomerase [Leptospira gomenensis]TGK40915.1 type I DNA topoisomerase [Leptospira gomenensis]TGK61205.1 type I DNA topoisomerase [Leptospira gomenensis]